MASTADVVCILHGGFPVPPWLAAHDGRLHVTVNDPEDHDYRRLPRRAIVTRNHVPRGFAANVNSALRTVFGDRGSDVAFVVNFDVEAPRDALAHLASALSADQRLAAVGAVLSGRDRAPTFSVGTLPTPTKEFLRAAGLRSGAALRAQRAVLRHTSRWAARNARPASGTRLLGAEEYLPWTCVAVRREAWDVVGELDERFPLYAEDIDWSIRSRRAGWQLAVADCGPVVHHERATRGARTDALYEHSHLELHRKWGWDANLRWQRRGLAARRRWPLVRLTEPLDWSLLTDADGDSTAAGATVASVASDRLAARLVTEWSSGAVATVTWLNHHSALQVRQARLATLAPFAYIGIDGLLMLGLLGGRARERTSADLVLPRLLPRLQGARIALVGTHRPSLDRAAAFVSEQLASAGSVVVDTRDGFSELPVGAEIERWVDSVRPNVVIVGLGAGLQEQWALGVARLLSSGLVITCGAFLEQLHQPRYYPSWAYPLRLNWAVRLVRDPKRMWRRYTIEALHAIRHRRLLRSEIERLAGFRKHRAVVSSPGGGDH